jgi:arylsulfatase A-like enzyme
VIRQGPWKLIENYDDDSIELYHLENDLNESQNLAQSEPKKAQDLLKKLQIWKRETRAESMQSNPLHSSR